VSAAQHLLQPTRRKQGDLASQIQPDRFPDLSASSGGRLKATRSAAHQPLAYADA
jgi:hypothetical protein